MNIKDSDKIALATADCTVESSIRVVGEDLVFTDNNSLSNWKLEDFRYVPQNGFIGQFVEKLFDAELTIDLDSNPEFSSVKLEGKTIEVDITINTVNINDETSTYAEEDAEEDDELESSDHTTYTSETYKIGQFVVTKVVETDTTGNIKLECSDFTKLFNTEYKDTIQYPCTTMELLDNVCNQVGIGYKKELDANGNTIYTNIKSIDENGLNAGIYQFTINDNIYEFELEHSLKLLDSLMYVDNDKIYTHRVEKIRNEYGEEEYCVYNDEIEVNIVESSNAVEIQLNRIPYIEFGNNMFVITSNQFTSTEVASGDNKTEQVVTNSTCRDVVKAIAQLGYTWARVDENNEVCLDFKVKKEDEIDELNILDGSTYYESTKQEGYYGPIDKITIGLKDIEGENISIFDNQYSTPLFTDIEFNDIYLNTITGNQDDEKDRFEIAIWNNPLTYTEDLRRIALLSPYAKLLFGMRYTALNIDTVGHIWLKGDDLIKLINTKGEELYSYPFNRTIKYQGYLDCNLTSISETQINRNYEYDTDLRQSISETRYIVDKQNKVITQIVKDTKEGKEELSKVTQTVKDIEYLFQITGGNNLIKNSVGLFFTSNNNPDYWVIPEGYNCNDWGYDGDIALKTDSSSMISVDNATIMTSDDNMGDIVAGLKSFSYKIKQDADTVTTVRIFSIVNGERNLYYEKMFDEQIDDFEQIYETPRRLSDDSVEDIGLRNCSFETNEKQLYLEIVSSGLGKAYFSDIIMNIGENKNVWQMAPGESSSTTMKLSRMGIIVFSNSSKTATLITSDGFRVVAYNNGSLGEEITRLTNDGVESKNLNITDEDGKIKIYKLVNKKIKMGYNDLYIEYIED